MTAWVALELPADPSLVGVARTMATSALAGRALPPERVDDVRTCVSEAVTNAVRAHGTAGVSEPVSVRVGLDENEVVIEVADHGPGLKNPDRPMPDSSDPAELAESGYGLAVMAALADAMDVVTGESPNGGTTIRLRFLLAALVV